MKKSKTKSMLSIAMVLALMFQIMQVALGNYEVNAQDDFINQEQKVVPANIRE